MSEKAPALAAVLGASAKPDRISNQAVRRLKESGFRVIPVHPGLGEVHGLAVVPDLASISDPVDVLTVYVGPGRVGPLIPDIVALNPATVILNPGAESPELEVALDRASISWEHACTLVLLRTGQLRSR